jgi:hypothetical protein
MSAFNGKQIVTQGSDHVAVATEDDMCLVPGSPPVAKPFPNQVKSDLLQAGKTETVLIEGKPVLTKRGELGPPSDPEHEGTLGGVTSKAYRGHAMAAEWSRDVGMEGQPVVRKDDQTTQNHNAKVFNCRGMLVNGDTAKLLAELYKKYGLTPRRYCGFLNGSNNAEARFRNTVASITPGMAATAQANGFEITADELAFNFISEGGAGTLASNIGDGIDAFGTAGADTLISNLTAVWRFLPPDLQAALANNTAGTAQNYTNERGETVTTMTNMTIEQATMANAGLYSWSKYALTRDLARRGVDINTLPRTQQFFWSTVYYNSGPGTGRNLLNRHGLDWSNTPWGGKDFPADRDAAAAFAAANSRNSQFNALWRTSSYEFMLRACGGSIATQPVPPKP